jgi:hypothetical protein
MYLLVKFSGFDGVPVQQRGQHSFFYPNGEASTFSTVLSILTGRLQYSADNQ